MAGADVQIPPPPPAPVQPHGARLYRLVPLAVLLGLALGGLTWWVGRGNLGVLLLGTILLVGASAAGAALVPRWELAAFRRRLGARERAYRDLLDVHRARLAELTTAELARLAQQDPDPAACARLASADVNALWQRDARQLRVRIGTVEGPSGINISAPRQANGQPPDPLIEAAQALAQRATRLAETPVSMPLAHTTALCGPREQVLNTVRALIVQLATHYDPDDLRLAIFFPAAEKDEWRWARWLPHLATEDGRRWLVSDARDVPTGALQLAIVADAGLNACVPAGAARITLTDQLADCAAGLDINADGSGTLHLPDAAPRPIDALDAVSVRQADQFARALAAHARQPASQAHTDGVVEVALDGTRRQLT